RLWEGQWARGAVVRGWMIVLATLAAGCIGFGILAWAVGDERPYATLGIAGIVLGSVTALAAIARIVIAFFAPNVSPRVRAGVTLVAWASAGFAIGCLVLASPGIS